MNGVKYGSFNVGTKDKEAAKEIAKEVVIQAISIVGRAEDSKLTGFLYSIK
ncbi:hypothetical protein HMPREF1982_02680 [Clostridiales bacterium oral taxon 876 str. F0540]|nr:hypothetical protein HMPREF1982_02680 [Clostridiales bacterium oral taxon 876 str. F0540]